MNRFALITRGGKGKDYPLAPTTGCDFICQCMMRLRWCIKRTEGQEPFTWSTIVHAKEALKLELSAEESEMLIYLSEVYVNSLYNYRGKDVKDPYVPYKPKQ